MSVKLVLTTAVLLILVLALGVVGTAGSTSSAVRVPSLRGKRLPLAELLIRNAGLRVGREDCDCTFGVVIKTNWYVCMQWPGRGRLVALGTRVRTYSVREMSDC